DAVAKIDKQLRRYKRRLTDRHEQTSYSRAEDDAAYTIFAVEEDVEDEVTADAPLVIAETRVDIPTASVADAVMMMDLRHTPALCFKNAGTGRHNMVYRRADGSIGWVEPK
ncbi:MAG: sigma 54 modulation/S30EA ribosomal C-terminal domain-containing protein, partial [Erythrobacter sp.]|nr:sigma 54 modulation/S30EA ribosomal C-terminal domain-containing protein [Erythrobacter sp.]